MKFSYPNSSVQSLEKGIRMAPSALERVRELKKQKDFFEVVRMAVRQGGCAGFSYVMTFESKDAIQQEDQVFDLEDLQIICDSKSLALLDGLLVEYGRSLTEIGGVFQFLNPVAIHTCCCGQSFSIQETI